MREVKRYSAALTHAETSPMYEAADGEWVVALDFDRVTAERDGLQLSLTTADQTIDDLQTAIGRRNQRIEELERDKARLDALESNCWDVRFDSSPNGDAGDSSINIEIVGHWMDQPSERVIGENYSENLRAAIDQAMAAPAYPPARPEYPELEPDADDDWHMNPCKQGHRDVGASGGVAACNQCGEKVEAATTQEAFEQWNASHQPAIEKPDSPFTEQFLEDHLGKMPAIPAQHDDQIPGTSGMRLNMLANQGE
ncbi:MULTISPECIES: phage scaffolding protein [unclassified Pseudomonas]|uniref:phage scaffolding protein n=1 Tax=unclassified Pseudomonas TaxID=196821 RepID=UPI002114F491|nr:MULTISPECIES: phage scaffolding protein [unclassified Pseudomonas]